MKAVINGSADAVRIARCKMYDEQVVILLNKQNEWSVIFSGPVMTERQIICKAAGLDANGIIVMAKSRPGSMGGPTPGDISCARAIRDCCSALDIRFVDYIIYDEEKYFSFAEEAVFALGKKNQL